MSFTKQIDQAVGELVCSIGTGTLRDAVAGLIMRHRAEAYELGLKAANPTGTYQPTHGELGAPPSEDSGS